LLAWPRCIEQHPQVLQLWLLNACSAKSILVVSDHLLAAVSVAPAFDFHIRVLPMTQPSIQANLGFAFPIIVI
jgi:hypothetical protein